METIEDCTELVRSVLEKVTDILKSYASNDCQTNCEHHVSTNALEAASMDERVVLLLERSQSLAVLNIASIPESELFQFYSNLLSLLVVHSLLSPMVSQFEFSFFNNFSWVF